MNTVCLNNTSMVTLRATIPTLVRSCKMIAEKAALHGNGLRHRIVTRWRLVHVNTQLAVLVTAGVLLVYAGWFLVTNNSSSTEIQTSFWSQIFTVGADSWGPHSTSSSPPQPARLANAPGMSDVDDAELQRLWEMEDMWENDTDTWVGWEHLQKEDWRLGNHERAADFELPLQYENALRLARETNTAYKIVVGIRVGSLESYRESAFGAWVSAAIEHFALIPEIDIRFCVYTAGQTLAGARAISKLAAAQDPALFGGKGGKPRGAQLRIRHFTDMGSALRAMPVSSTGDGGNSHGADRVNWVVLCEDSTYVNMPQLVKRLLAEAPAAGKICFIV